MNTYTYVASLPPPRGAETVARRRDPPTPRIGTGGSGAPNTEPAPEIEPAFELEPAPEIEPAPQMEREAARVPQPLLWPVVAGHAPAAVLVWRTVCLHRTPNSSLMASKRRVQRPSALRFAVTPCGISNVATCGIAEEAEAGRFLAEEEAGA